MRRRSHGSASPAWLVACRGLAVGALAIGLVIGILAVFGDTDGGETTAIAAPRAPDTTAGADAVGSTRATTTTAPAAVSSEDPTAPSTTGGAGAASGSAAAGDVPATSAGDPAPAAPGPTPSAGPTRVVYPTALVSLGGGGSLNVSMTGFSPGKSLFVVCYRLPYEGEIVQPGQKWVQIGGYAGATTANGDGAGSGSCSLNGAQVGAHVFAVVNDSEAYSNHLQL